MPGGPPLTSRAGAVRREGRRPLAARAVRALRILPLVLVLALPACARPVAVEPTTPDEAAIQACRSFIASLPDSLSTVGGRRTVRPDSGLTAAYGDPPVSIRCGVATPSTLTPTSQLVTVEGVDWFPEELTEGWLLTTVGRTAGVEITVPAAHSPAPSVAADLAPLIAAALPPA